LFVFYFLSATCLPAENPQEQFGIPGNHVPFILQFFQNQ